MSIDDWLLLWTQGTRADEESEVRRLLHDTYPEAPEDDPPGQAEVLA